MTLALHGIGISRGIAMGDAHIAQRNRLEVSERRVADKEIEHEVHRFRTAVRQAQKELREIRQRIPGSTPAEIFEFIDTHALMLEDSALIDPPAQMITALKCNAEWALQAQRNRLAAVFEAMDDPYLASRMDDIDQVVERIQKALSTPKASADSSNSRNFRGIILVADDLAPADLTLLHHKGILGLVLEHGGPLSHTAILARSLKIPTAMGVHHARQLLLEGESLIVDGERGLVLAKTPRAIQKHYRERIQRDLESQRKLKKVRHLKAVTKDRQHIILQANVDLPSDLDQLQGSGFDGIGLFRTEYLFMNRQSAPDEEEQYQAYASVINAMQGRPVTIRTLDLGADKQVDGGRGGSPVAVNPALGLRAIRLCLSDQNLFIPQLRALLRAACLGPLRILIPMLSNTRELFQVRGLIKTTLRDLKREGQKVGEQFQLGGMIEVPAAALSARTFAKHLDFLSIGTNDLIQYTLAVDRVDDQVSYLYDPSHPAVTRLLRIIIDEAGEVGTPVSMCGEMAGDPNYTRLLLSMGLRDFSLPAAALPEVKHVIRCTDIGALKPLARRLQTATNPTRITALMREMNRGI